MRDISTLINGLEEKLKKAKDAAQGDIRESLNQDDIKKRLDFSSYLNACCDFEDIQTIITALREAKEMALFYASVHRANVLVEAAKIDLGDFATGVDIGMAKDWVDKWIGEKKDESQ